MEKEVQVALKEFEREEKQTAHQTRKALQNSPRLRRKFALSGIVMTRQGIWRSRHPSVNGKAVTRQDIEGQYDDYERVMKERLKRKAKGRAGAASAARKKQKKERKC